MSSSAAPSTRNETPGMARLINVSDELRADASLLCEELESGNILYFPQTPFSFSEEDLRFLLASKQTGAAYHKNIAYRPGVDRITGLDKTAGRDAERLRGIMRWYSQQAQRFLATLLPPYAGECKLDFASYRPLEERGRHLPGRRLSP